MTAKNSSRQSGKGNLMEEAGYFDDYARNIHLNKIDINAAFNLHLREGKFFLDNLPKSLKGKKVLDIGCGAGAISVFFAAKGADTTGIDISPEMIKTARKLANIHQVSQLVKFKTGNVEKLNYHDDTFDIVIGKAVLHHIDLVKSLTEIQRVLKPGGVALFSEPLAYNPLVKLYDKFASKGLRSDGERRLGLGDIAIMQQKFTSVKWLGINITSFILFIFDFLYLKLTQPKMPTGWFERVESGHTLQRGYNICNKIDLILPKAAQLLGWKIVIACKK